MRYDCNFPKANFRLPKDLRALCVHLPCGGGVLNTALDDFRDPYRRRVSLSRSHGLGMRKGGVRDTQAESWRWRPPVTVNIIMIRDIMMTWAPVPTVTPSHGALAGRARDRRPVGLGRRRRGFQSNFEMTIII